jgi:hypothetical protein
MGDGVDGDVTAGTAFVLDDDLLAPDIGKPVCNDAGRGISSAAGRKSNYKPDRTARPGLRPRAT